jgi:hypothetical protein
MADGTHPAFRRLQQAYRAYEQAGGADTMVREAMRSIVAAAERAGVRGLDADAMADAALRRAARACLTRPTTSSAPPRWRPSRPATER